MNFDQLDLITEALESNGFYVKNKYRDIFVKEIETAVGIKELFVGTTDMGDKGVRLTASYFSEGRNILEAESAYTSVEGTGYGSIPYFLASIERLVEQSYARKLFLLGVRP